LGSRLELTGDVRTSKRLISGCVGSRNTERAAAIAPVVSS
jgi:hypothetical protein